MGERKIKTVMRKKFLISAILLLFILLSLLIITSTCGNILPSEEKGEDRFSVPNLADWHKESGIRVPDRVSTSTIRLNNGQYRIFYPGGEGTASSISSDGLTFTEEAGTRVSRGSGNEPDVAGAKDPDIVDEGSYYRMYYTAIGADNKHKVMSATSTDGFIFTKEVGVRIDYFASYDELADVQSVVKVSSSEYWMYFVHDWKESNSIKGAFSTNGLSWEVKALSGFSKNCMDPEVLLDKNGNLVMFFAAPRKSDSYEPMDIYKATSKDGLSWTVAGRAIAPEKTEEGQLVGDPDIVQLSDNTYRMYYYGMTKNSSNILSATAEAL